MRVFFSRRDIGIALSAIKSKRVSRVRGKSNFFFFLKTDSPLQKIAKMIGMTLRYKWITWVMFMDPGLEPVLP